MRRAHLPAPGARLLRGPAAGLLGCVLGGAVACQGGSPSPSLSPAPATSRSDAKLPPPASVTSGAASGAATPALPDLPRVHGGGGGVVTGRAGMVVSVEANATRAGVEVLDEGGNAVDAAVAVGFALAVTHPSAGNLGGGGFLVYRPRNGPAVVVDFRERAPLSVTKEAFAHMIRGGAVGPEAVATPGTVAGLDLALARFGHLPRARVIEPALALARDGFRLARRQAQTIAWSWGALAQDPAARTTFGKGGRPKVEGDLLVQPELARTLERIRADGDAGFYAGPTAEALAALSKRGGLVSLEDLATYRAIVRAPLTTTYRGLTVELPPPPSAGGVGTAALLALSEEREAWKLPALSPDEAHLFAELAARASAIRRFEVGDPDSLGGFDEKAVRALVEAPGRALSSAPPYDPAHHTPSSKVHPLFADAMKELEHTTHFSVVDGEGNAVSCTTTLSASFGSRAMAAGVVLNNSLAAFGTVGANQLAPGRHMTTSMSPAVVSARGATVLVVGSPGGDTIPNTVARVIRNVVDYGMTLDLAVDAPRLHQGLVPDELRYEASRPPPRAVLAELRRRGHVLSSKTGVIGDVDAIVLEGGVAYGYADRREGGLAAGPAPR